MTPLKVQPTQNQDQNQSQNQDQNQSQNQDQNQDQKMASLSWERTEKTINAIRHLNSLRAQMADDDLTERARYYAPLRAEVEARQSRRAAEKHRGVVIPPGVWDADLDARHSFELYGVDLPKDLADAGYAGWLGRNNYWTWNGYVDLPESHPWYGIDLSISYFYDHPCVGLPKINTEITFSRKVRERTAGPRDEFGDYPEREIFRVGFDHCHGHDVCPTGGRSLVSFEATNFYLGPLAVTGEGYVDFGEASEEVVNLAKWLQECAVHIAANPEALKERFTEDTV